MLSSPKLSWLACTCSLAEASRVYGGSRPFDLPDGLDPHHFSSVRVQSAAIPLSGGCSWLRAQAPDLLEQVTVSWRRNLALRTTWGFFTAHWDDFCYPASDDVLILPDIGRWALRYHHEEIFYFGERNA